MFYLIQFQSTFNLLTSIIYNLGWRQPLILRTIHHTSNSKASILYIFVFGYGTKLNWTHVYNYVQLIHPFQPTEWQNYSILSYVYTKTSLHTDFTVLTSLLRSYMLILRTYLHMQHMQHWRLLTIFKTIHLVNSVIFPCVLYTHLATIENKFILRTS